MRNERIQQNESLAVGCLIGKANQILLGELGKALKDAGLDLTTTEYLVMRALYRLDGIQQCEIADMIGRDKAAVCRCVSGLALKNLVRTETVSHKCLRVFATDSGHKIKPRIMRVAEIRHKALTDLMTSEEFAAFIRGLRKITGESQIY